MKDWLVGYKIESAKVTLFRFLLFFHLLKGSPIVILLQCVKKIFYILLFVWAFFLNGFAQKDLICPIKYFNTVPYTNIQGLEVVSDSKVWFSGSRGVWGFTEDGGTSWHIDSIKVDSVYPEFRSMAVLNDSTVLLLSIVSPAYLFKTTNKGKTWRLVYKNTHKDIFFDCMKFYDDKRGLALGDPINGCPQIIRTEDGGETWTQVDCALLPKTDSGEAFFAASNSNIALHKNHIWFASGGFRSRLFHSVDAGKSYTSYDTPLPQGEKMTGIYSIDFFDDKLGAIAGGNYVKRDSTIINLALTRDGGKTWKIVKHRKPYFSGRVKFRTPDEIYFLGGAGIFKYDIMKDEVFLIKEMPGVRNAYINLAISPSGKTVWVGGIKGTIGQINLNK